MTIEKNSDTSKLSIKDQYHFTSHTKSKSINATKIILELSLLIEITKPLFKVTKNGCKKNHMFLVYYKKLKMSSINYILCKNQ